MDIQSLIFFKEVAYSGSFSAASEKLQYAQSNISTKMHQLEDDLGTILFYRNNRGVTLTQKGEMFLTYAEKILKTVEESKSAMVDEKDATGRLNIGSVYTITQAQMPKLLSQYHMENPNVEISIVNGSTTNLLNGVLDRSLDLSFISGGVNHAEIEAIPFTKEKMVLAMAKQKGDSSQLPDLREETFLAFEPGCCYRTLQEQYLSDQGIIARHTIQFDSVSAFIAGVCGGVGIGLLPSSVLSDYIEKDLMDVIPIPEKYSNVQTHLIYRKDALITKAIEKFIEQVKNY